MNEHTLPRWLLILSVVGPLVLVGSVVLLVNLNNWLMTFEYDLVYVTCEGPGPGPARRVSCGQYLEQRYAIIDGTLLVRDDEEVYARIFGTGEDLPEATPDQAVFAGWVTRLFVHDPVQNRSREVSPEDLEARTLTGAQVAPDGTQLRHDQQYYSSPFFIFGGGSSRSSTLLVQAGGQREITLAVPFDRWNRFDQFRQLGWASREE